MPISESEARSRWQAAWRRLPAPERGGARQAFAFISERAHDLPSEWEGLAGEPWTTIQAWLREADEDDGIEWRAL